MGFDVQIGCFVLRQDAKPGGELGHGCDDRRALSHLSHLFESG